MLLPSKLLLCVFSPKPGSAPSRTFHKIPLKFFGRRRYKYLILLCNNNIGALYHFFILNILMCFIKCIVCFAERKFYNHCNTMEIDMTEIARDEKASKQPPLAAKLLNKFTVIKSNIHNSPIFNWSALKST